MRQHDIKSIEEEDPRKAPGVRPFISNDALAERDYLKRCDNKKVIAIVKGYWIRWCSTHHQPWCMCKIKEMED